MLCDYLGKMQEYEWFKKLCSLSFRLLLSCKVQAEESQEKERLFTTVQEVILMNISYVNFFYSRAASLGLASFTFSLYTLDQKSHHKNKKMHMD